jgi:hypothetical protein
MRSPLDFPTAECENYQTLYVQKSLDEGNTYEPVTQKTTRWENPPFAKEHDFIVDSDICLLKYGGNEDYIQISMDGGQFFFESVNGYHGDFFIHNSVIYYFSDSENCLYQLIPWDEQLFLIQQFNETSEVKTFSMTPAGNKVYASVYDPATQPFNIQFSYTYQDSLSFNGNYNWQTPFNLTYEDQSKIALNFDIHQNVYLSFLNSVTEDQQYGDLWLTTGQLPDLTVSWEIEIPASIEFSLSNYPNPFNPSTTISFTLSSELNEQDELSISIYNLKGQKVKTLECSNSFAAKARNSLSYSVTWDGTDDNNKPVSSGIYFYKLKAGKFEKTRKCLLMK